MRPAFLRSSEAAAHGCRFCARREVWSPPYRPNRRHRKETGLPALKTLVHDILDSMPKPLRFCLMCGESRSEAEIRRGYYGGGHMRKSMIIGLGTLSAGLVTTFASMDRVRSAIGRLRRRNQRRPLPSAAGPQPVNTSSARDHEQSVAPSGLERTTSESAATGA